MWTGITGLGVALGPITGGLLLEHFSWSSVFFATIPIAGVAAVLQHEREVPARPQPGVGQDVREPLAAASVRGKTRGSPDVRPAG